MTTPMNILITGSNGQLGNECRQLSALYPDSHFVFTDVDTLSITNPDAVEAIFSQYAFDYCINAAAYTAVDAAEQDRDNAFAVNAAAVGYLAAACQRYQCRLIHISTDYVFNGENANGYDTNDDVEPINVYGESKLEGERLALQYDAESIVIRTSWVYSYYGKNFVKTMMRLMQEKDELSVVCDQTGRPTYAADLAKAIFHIIYHHAEPQPGLYHFANQGVITWYDFACAIKEIGDYTCQIHPIPSTAYPVPAKRPRFSILKTDKIVTTFGVNIPEWRESLKACMELLMASH